VVEGRVRPVAGVVALIAGLREIRGDVIRIRSALVVLQVAGHACGAVQAVIVVHVAVGAGARRNGVQPSERESSAGVIEGRVQPCRGAVALVAGLWEIRRNVIRIGGALVVLQVTSHARGGVQAVVVVDMAIRALAWRDRVQAGKREARAVVVEGRIRPVAGVVALITGLREIRRNVIRIRSALVVLQVAGHARRAVQAVIVVDVAIAASTRRNRVHTCQSKTGCGVIEFTVGPLDRVMALLASRRESRMRYWRCRVVEIGLVTTDARGIRDVVVVVDVAIGASTRRNSMRAGQREARSRVIKLRRPPGRGVVTHVARLRKSLSNVVGIRCPLEILEVARNARIGRQVVVVVDVAVGTGAWGDSVHARQREVDTVMVECCRRPPDGRMACIAGRRKIR